MATLAGSVGINGVNNRTDVEWIQILLNNYKIPGVTTQLNIDGNIGDKTCGMIETFQRQILKMVKSDGRVDPGGKTFQKLTEAQAGTKNTIFPLSFKPDQSYQTGMSAFGANRSSGDRKHAGCDLYAAKDTAIRAIKDGKVIQDYPFYLGTRALEVDHGDMVVRYGEISHVAPGVTRGAIVKRGQFIAYVGELSFASGNTMSMLHIEFYKGTESGPLTVRDAKPYQRRSDLLDPTSYLNAASMN